MILSLQSCIQWVKTIIIFLVTARASRVISDIVVHYAKKTIEDLLEINCELAKNKLCCNSRFPRCGHLKYPREGGGLTDATVSAHYTCLAELALRLHRWYFWYPQCMNHIVYPLMNTFHDIVHICIFLIPQLSLITVCTSAANSFPLSITISVARPSNLKQARW